MKRKIIIVTAVFCCSSVLTIYAQNKDKAVFREFKPGFYQNSILRDDREVKEKIEPARSGKSFAVDLTNIALPNKIDLYRNRQWHNPPISQGNTSTCWCFSTTSFLDTEAYRINKIHVKLS